MFQVLSIQRFWTDDLNATRKARHAGNWFAGDALNATDVLDSGGVQFECLPHSSVEEVKLTWADVSGDPHYVVCSVSGGQLLRNFDGNGTPLTMADGVVANTLSFTLCANTLRVKMDVLADGGTAESLDLITYMRKLN